MIVKMVKKRHYQNPEMYYNDLKQQANVQLKKMRDLIYSGKYNKRVVEHKLHALKEKVHQYVEQYLDFKTQGKEFDEVAMAEVQCQKHMKDFDKHVDGLFGLSDLKQQWLFEDGNAALMPFEQFARVSLDGEKKSVYKSMFNNMIPKRV